MERINGADSIVVNDDPDIQVGSGYWQIDVLQKFLLRQSDQVSHILNVQYSTSSDVPRYYGSHRPPTACRVWQWYYGPRDRLLGSYAPNWQKGGAL
ncbi:MAG: hypothetical protein IPJ40_13390 [Saprospirales bacterium]|nr:hypothetical protein [Saprospirales bacterium]